MTLLHFGIIKEGVVNENRLANNFVRFNAENFNNGNFWRRQGLVIKGNKSVFKDDTISYKTFSTRELASNEISTPMYFYMVQKLNINPI